MPEEQTQLRLASPLHLRPTTNRHEYEARLIAAGTVRAMGNKPSHLQIPADTLHSAVSLFDGKPTFIDHPAWLDYPSLRDLAGITLANAHWAEETESINATIRLYETPAGDIIDDLFRQILTDDENGDPVPDIGLSAVLWAKWKAVEIEDGGPSKWEMREISHVESVDFVFEPGADGRVDAALASLSSLGLSGDPPGAGESPNPESLGLAGSRDPEQISPNPIAFWPHDQEERTQTEVTNMPPKKKLIESQETPSPESPPTNAEDWIASVRQSAVDAALAGSGLPQSAQDSLRLQTYEAPAELQTAIDAMRQVLAEAIEDNVVQVGDAPPRSSGITLGRTGMEQIESAFEALMLGTKPPDGVQPLTGIRELYHLLSGDFEMTGLFLPDNIYLANVNSSTMANLVANILNKSVINQYQTYPIWWSPFVTEEDFTTLQQVSWITVGGVGELPTVAEGAAYTELTWDDAAETADFVKKGGYLGLTLEAIDKDDTRRIQLAPRALAQAAWLTLGKTISAIFTDNSGVGPTMADSVALFHAATHGNLLTTALSWSEWNVVRIAMMKQAEINAAERLGYLTAPKFCLVPIDLENTALQVLASANEPGTADNDVNPYATGDERMAMLSSARQRVIVVPFWTDTNNWAAVADPNLYPSIAIGYRYGRQPEIFSVASPTAGLMFSNDTMPVKVRFFYAAGPVDYRGLHKSNVA